jgi:hypothetical protein
MRYSAMQEGEGGNKAMRIIITGGTGFIGRALTNNLVAEDHEVIILTRTLKQPEQGEKTNPKYVVWDTRTSQGWSEWVNSAQAIVNLAGESIAGDNFFNLIARRWTKEQKEKIIASRVNAGNAIVEAVKTAHHKPAVIIQASAVGYYGDRGEEELTEDASHGNDFLAQVCQRWEASTAELEKIELRRVIIRTAGIVMGTEGGSLPFMLLPYKFFAGGPLGSGQQWVSWIHLADEINAIKYLIQHSETTGIYNLCAPQACRNITFSQILGKVLKRPSFVPMPAIALRLLFGEKAAVLLASQKQMPARLQESGYKFLFQNLEEALKNILILK